MLECFFRLFREEMLPSFLNDSTFIRSIFTKKKTWTETALSKSVPATPEAPLLFHGVVHLNGCMPVGRLQAKM